MGTNSIFLTIRYEAFINKRLTFFNVGAGTKRVSSPTKKELAIKVLAIFIIVTGGERDQGGFDKRQKIIL